MDPTNLLLGKKVLIVDDETDILDTMEEVLFMCEVDVAQDFESAQRMLGKNNYDVAVLDIMGVDGYELLKIANTKNIPSVILTAHALSPDNFQKSMQLGARAYIPKTKMVELNVILSDVFKDKDKKAGSLGKWFDRLKGYYDKKFGRTDWLEKDSIEESDN